MVEPTNLKPRCARSLLNSSDKGVCAWMACPRLRRNGLQLTKSVRIRNGGIDLQPIANYPRVVQQRRDLSFVVTRDLRRIETVERLAIVVTFAQDCFPTQSGLCAFENQKLKQTRVVVNGHAPFLVVIGDR